VKFISSLISFSYGKSENATSARLAAGKEEKANDET
jgi:hypothetical protein